MKERSIGDTGDPRLPRVGENEGVISIDSLRRRPRRPLIALAAVLIGLAGLGVACAGDPSEGSGAPIEASTVAAAELEEMAEVFEEALAGAQVNGTLAWAENLAAVRPFVLEHPQWPEADYAVLASPPAEGPEAPAGLVFWAGGADAAAGWAPVCAAASVDRSAARLRLQQIQCPAEVPAAPAQLDAPRDRAALLDLPLPVPGELVTGHPAPVSVMVGNYRPAQAAEADGPCRADALAAAFDSGNAAGNTDDYILRVQNVSASPCLLPALVGLQVDDGQDTIQPPWDQAGPAVALHPWESAATTITYRPSQGPSAHQIITAVLPAGPMNVTAIPGIPQMALQVSDAVPITATAWEAVGYGPDLGTAENGLFPGDIAARCTNPQLAITTPPARQSSGDQAPERLTYRLINISTRTCRIDAGAFTAHDVVPTVQVPTTVVVQPGFAADLDAETAAPDLEGTLLVDGAPIPVTTP